MFRPRRIKIFLALVGVVALGYVASGRLGFSSVGIPADFQDARFQGAIVAQDIVNLSNEMTGSLEKINELDREGKVNDALNLTVDLVKKSQEVKARAIDLSTQLEKMTGGLATIRDEDARAAALESISSRLAIIGRLISYSNYLEELMIELRGRFGGEANSEEIKTLVNQINSEVTAINSFNRQAGQAMDRFDEIVKEE